MRLHKENKGLHLDPYLNVSTYIYINCIKYSDPRSLLGSFLLRIFLRLRSMLIKSIDPPCKMSIRGKELYMPLSHSLPFYITSLPHYDMAMSRIGNFIRSKYGFLKGIDIGANIGDTISICYDDESDHFLAIEANPFFFNYLSQNFTGKNVKMLNVLCSSAESKKSFKISAVDGTAIINESHSGVELEEKPLDLIIRDNPEFIDANFLKVDTDGYDFAILAGAKKFLRSNLPAIFFESYPLNESYIKSLFETLETLRDLGYKTALIYDNFGYLFNRLELNDLLLLKYPLFWQLTYKQHCFDILLMKEDDLVEFLDSELAHFTDTIPDEALKKTVNDLLKLKSNN